MSLARVIALGCVWIGWASLAPRAAADDVHLDNGEVIEGKAARVGDKVVIELPSGQVALSADSVQHIDRRESIVEHFDKLYRALKPADVTKRLQLADYCRDHDMRERERRLLEEVIERQPDHPEARARLGYVKTARGWVTYAEHMRQQGKVLRDGQWMSRAQALELDRMQAQARAATHDTNDINDIKAQKLELARQKVELERQKLELERSRTRSTLQQFPWGFGGYLGSYGWGYGAAPWGHAASPRGGDRVGHHGGHGGGARPAPAFPINGVRDPRDSSWSLPGVRDPRVGLP